jgi:hypothetical protein
MLEYLLQKKCDPNTRTRNAHNCGHSKFTCLHQAVYHNKLNNVTLLLKAGADTQARSHNEHGPIPIEGILSTLNMRIATIISRHEKEQGVEHRPRAGWNDKNMIKMHKYIEAYHATGDPDVAKDELNCAYLEDFQGGVPNELTYSTLRSATWSKELQHLVAPATRASQAKFEEKQRHFKDSVASVLRKTPEICSYPSCPVAYVDLRRCARCGGAKYCDKSCQVARWPAHKADCKKGLRSRSPAAESSTYMYV